MILIRDAWNMKVLDKKLTKLPIDLYCITAKETNYPLRIFILYKN